MKDTRKILLNRARSEFANYHENKTEIELFQEGKSELNQMSILSYDKFLEFAISSTQTIKQILDHLSDEQKLFIHYYTTSDCKLKINEIATQTGLKPSQLRKWEKEIMFCYIDKMGWNYVHD
jgi:hypothetical protein